MSSPDWWPRPCRLPHAADSKWNRVELEKFFKLGWDLSPEARLQADEHYDELRPFAQGDSRLKYSLAVIKIKQLKYQDALKLVTEVVATDKKNLNAWQAKIWLTVLTKNYSQAMVDLEKAAQAMPPIDESNDKNAEVKLEMATFMGRVFGFLEGPAASHTNEDDRIAQRKKLTAKLSPERKAAFLKMTAASGDRQVLGTHRSGDRLQGTGQRRG